MDVCQGNLNKISHLPNCISLFQVSSGESIKELKRPQNRKLRYLFLKKSKSKDIVRMIESNSMRY